MALIEAANSAAGRTKDTYLRAQYLRIKRRRGHKKAIVAVAHSILVSAYHELAEGRPNDELAATTSYDAKTTSASRNGWSANSNASGTTLRWTPWRNRRGDGYF